jgi:hypothetical protein
MPSRNLEERKRQNKAASRRYYEKNKKKVIQANSLRKKAGLTAFYAYKATLKCIQCGEDHPATLDFHHHTPNPANKKIFELIRNGRYSLAMSEIKEKCWVLCSNCHRKHHYEERSRKKSLPEQG